MEEANQRNLRLADFNGKYVTVMFKVGVTLPFRYAQGILDSSNAPILRVEDKEFEESDVCSYCVGAPDPSPRRL